MDFGAFFKSKRIEQHITLRAFCRQHGLNASNISKLERGRLPAPSNEDKLRKYATYLRLDSTDRATFMHLAAISSRIIPAELTDEEVAKLLPVIFRRLGDKDITEQGLREVVELIRSA